jgi:hypothetical protein
MCGEVTCLLVRCGGFIVICIIQFDLDLYIYLTVDDVYSCYVQEWIDYYWG